MIRVAAALCALALGAGVAAAYVAAGPDPQAQAQADGCARDLAAIHTRDSPNWVYVGDKDAPAAGPAPAARWLHGVVSGGGREPWLASQPSGADDPVTHDAYDVLINVLPDGADADLMGTANATGDGAETGRVHTERESLGLPTWVWPEPGDRVAELGSWVWDCDHFGGAGERTEIHPYRALWVQRRFSPTSPTGESEGDLWISTEATPAGVEAECAHSSKGDRAAFKSCLLTAPRWLDVSGDYSFTLPAPPRPRGAGALQARVVDHGGPQPTVTVSGRQATVTLHLAVPPGQSLVVAKQVYLGWTNVPAAERPEHLRVRFKSLLVRRAMDPDTPLETTRHGQVTKGPTGEWNVYWDVAGLWGTWPQQVLNVADGQLVKGSQTVDVYVPRRTRWRVFVFTRECDFGSLSFSDQSKAPWPCPTQNEFGNAVGDDNPGIVVNVFATPEDGLGLHRGIPLKVDSTCPPANPSGCYELDYVVMRVG